MARVVINHFLAQLIGEKAPKENSEIELTANNVRELIRALEKEFPAVKNKLHHGLAVAIDGEIHRDALLFELEEDSEVLFITAIEAG